MKIYIIGFMGAGKTHLGRDLSRRLGIPFFDLDEQVVNHEDKSINEIFAEKGEEHFRLLEKDILHIITESHDSFVMATGGGTPCYFNNIEYMKRGGITVWINTPLDTLFERLIRERDARPLLKDLSDDQVRAYIIKKFSDRKIYYEQAAVVILEDDGPAIEKLIGEIFHA